jgi:primosomal protein N' (replication factor Y)
MVLRMALRMGEHLGPGRERIGVRLGGPAPERMTAARARVLHLLANGLTLLKSEAAHEAGVSVGVIDGLIDAGALETIVLPPEPVAPQPDPEFRKPEFSLAQLAAADALRTTVAQGGYSVTLLDGVTGSGKTEVYFEGVAENIRRNRQTLILMPEIALTAQFLDRFSSRFGVRPAEWHSQLSQRKRARTWAAVAANEVRVVVGARSALFLPYADLGLVIVDEEHDPAYKQEDGAHYHARDMAVVRGSIAKFPVILASATPSVESEVNARRGRYRHVHLPERFGGAHLPSIEAIDMRREGPPRGRFISPRLAEACCGLADARASGLVVSQSPRLCTADAVSRLRVPSAMSELRCVAGRPSIQSVVWFVITAVSRCLPRWNAPTVMPRTVSPQSVRRRKTRTGGRRTFSASPYSCFVERSRGIGRAPPTGT